MHIGKRILMADGPCEVVAITDQGHHVLEPLNHQHKKIKIKPSPLERFILIFKNRTKYKGQNIDIYS